VCRRSCGVISSKATPARTIASSLARCGTGTARMRRSRFVKFSPFLAVRDSSPSGLYASSRCFESDHSRMFFKARFRLSGLIYAPRAVANTVPEFRHEVPAFACSRFWCAWRVLSIAIRLEGMSMSRRDECVFVVSLKAKPSSWWTLVCRTFKILASRFTSSQRSPMTSDRLRPIENAAKRVGQRAHTPAVYKASPSS
jgi:hypothetical protein